MTTVLVGGTGGLVALQEQPFGWEVWERTDEHWWGRRVYCLTLVEQGTGILTGTERQLLRSVDSGTTWTVVLDQMVRTLVADPTDPTTLLAGTQPAALWRSDDSGRSWYELPGPGTNADRASWYLPGDTPLETLPVARISALVADQHQPHRFYLGVECGGIWRSDDSGTNWHDCSAGLPTVAIHNVVIHPLEPETVFVATDTGVYRSIDAGKSWANHGFDTGAGYTRALLALPLSADEGPCLLAGPAEVDFWGWDEEAEGATSRLLRSTDDGASWHDLPIGNGLPASFAAPISVLTTDSADDHTVWLGTWDGRVYRSQDRGQSWLQVGEDLGQIWTLLPLPDR